MAIRRSNKEKIQFAYGDSYGVENIGLNGIEQTYNATDSLLWINVKNRIASNVDSADLIGCLINVLSIIWVLAEILALLIQRIQSPSRKNRPVYIP